MRLEGLCDLFGKSRHLVGAQLRDLGAWPTGGARCIAVLKLGVLKTRLISRCISCMSIGLVERNTWSSTPPDNLNNASKNLLSARFARSKARPGQLLSLTSWT